MLNLIGTAGLEFNVFCFFNHLLRPRKLSEIRQQSEDVKSIFTDLLDKTHLVFHHRDRSRKIRYLYSIYHFQGNRWRCKAGSENGEEMIIFKCKTDGRNSIICPFDKILDKKHKGKTICSTPRFHLNSNLCPLLRQVNKKGKAMEVCMDFVGVYCGDVFQYIMEDCAQE